MTLMASVKNALLFIAHASIVTIKWTCKKIIETGIYS